MSALATEKIPPKEAEYIADIVSDMRHFIEKKYPPGQTKRHFHPKMHGCVKATFTVNDSLPDALRKGLFAEPKTYEAWVRFSSAPPNERPDYKATGLGMAIKIKGLNNALNEEQDFLMTTSPVLSPGHVANYRKAMKMIIYRGLHAVTYVLNPANWRRIALTLKFQRKFFNVLEEQYFTGAPILWGEGLAVKCSAAPKKTKTSKKPKKKSSYFLQQRLAVDLEETEAHFDFKVQLQENVKTEPIEDTSTEWKTPFHTVGSLTIPKQSFQQQDRIIFGENLLFSPWNCIPEHRPLGGINRARKEVYQLLGELRKNRNGVQ